MPFVFPFVNALVPTLKLVVVATVLFHIVVSFTTPAVEFSFKEPPDAISRV